MKHETRTKPRPAESEPIASAELERQILGAIMRAAKNGTQIAHEVRPIVKVADRFHESSHGDVYTAIMAIADTGGVATAERVIDQLRLSGRLTSAEARAENPLRIRDMVDAANIRTVDELTLACQQLIDYSLRRQLDAALVEARSALRESTDDPVRVVANVTRTAWGILDGHIRHARGSNAGELARMFREHQRVLASPDEDETDEVFYLQSTIHDLNGAFGKRVGPGSLVVIGAHTSVGKTVLAADLVRANGIHGNLRPVHMTLEETRVETQERITAAETGVDLAVLQEPAVMAPEEAKKLEEFFSQLEANEDAYWVEEMSGASLAEIVSKIRVLHATIGARLFIVDYLQIIDIPEKERRERELAFASQRFKGLAGELGVIVVVLAQLNDEMHGRNLPLRYPMVRDLRECKAVAHDANVIVLIDRPEQHFDDPEEAVFSDGTPAVGLARLHVAKIRRGKKKRVTVHFEGQYQRFGNWVPDSWRAEPRPRDTHYQYIPHDDGEVF